MDYLCSGTHYVLFIIIRLYEIIIASFLVGLPLEALACDQIYLLYCVTKLLVNSISDLLYLDMLSWILVFKIFLLSFVIRSYWNAVEYLIPIFCLSAFITQ